MCIIEIVISLHSQLKNREKKKRKERGKEDERVIRNRLWRV